MFKYHAHIRKIKIKINLTILRHTCVIPGRKEISECTAVQSLVIELSIKRKLPYILMETRKYSKVNGPVDSPSEHGLEVIDVVTNTETDDQVYYHIQCI